MSILQQLEERPPTKEEWSIERANECQFVDCRKTAEARLGNFLRVCAAVWHPANLHVSETPDIEQLHGMSLYAQSAQFGENMRERIQALLADIEQ